MEVCWQALERVRIFCSQMQIFTQTAEQLSGSLALSVNSTVCVLNIPHKLNIIEHFPFKMPCVCKHDTVNSLSMTHSARRPLGYLLGGLFTRSFTECFSRRFSRCFTRCFTGRFTRCFIRCIYLEDSTGCIYRSAWIF